jgi:hypothetical protein
VGTKVYFHSIITHYSFTKEDVKYLGLHLDRSLTWHKHIFAKRKQLVKVRQSVGKFVLVSGTHLGPATNFLFSLFDYF